MKAIVIFTTRDWKNIYITKKGTTIMHQVPKFKIEQIALCPTNPTKARKLLEDLGLTEWFVDNVHATGVVRGAIGENHALLQFNYQAGNGSDAAAGKPLELEVLHYTNGNNWMTKNPNSVSHLGMHCSDEELEQFRAYFYHEGIGIAQEVKTLAHTNPAIKDTRRYQYAIFDTKDILGVDLKFIVRKEYPSDEDLDQAAEEHAKNRAIVVEAIAADLGPVQGAKRKFVGGVPVKPKKNTWTNSKKSVKK